MLKEGYAPIEQYQTRGHQGPYTDLYAFASVYYHAVTGIKLPQSIERLIDAEVNPPSYYGVELGDRREAALMKALSVHANDRYQTVPEFKADFDAPQENQQSDIISEIVYNAAVSDMNAGKYAEASRKFGTIRLWKDSEKKLSECEASIKEIREEAERRRLCARTATPMRKESGSRR